MIRRILVILIYLALPLSAHAASSGDWLNIILLGGLSGGTDGEVGPEPNYQNWTNIRQLVAVTASHHTDVEFKTNEANYTADDGIGLGIEYRMVNEFDWTSNFTLEQSHYEVFRIPLKSEFIDSSSDDLIEDSIVRNAKIGLGKDLCLRKGATREFCVGPGLDLGISWFEMTNHNVFYITYDFGLLGRAKLGESLYLYGRYSTRFFDDEDDLTPLPEHQMHYSASVSLAFKI